MSIETEKKTEQESTQATTSEKDTVAYETHKKLLSEKKRRDEENAELRSRLDAIEREKKEKEELELQEKEEFKKLVEIKQKNLEDIESKYKQQEKMIKDSMKLSAFLEALPGSVEKQYMGLVDLDKIVIDPTTGEPDSASVQEYAKNFEVQFSTIIKRPNGGTLPSQAAAGSSVSTNLTQYKTMTLKDKKENLKSMVEAYRRQKGIN